MAVNTIIFDLDGTLLYTLEDLTDSTNYALSRFGYNERTIDEVKRFVGNGVGLLIERAIPDGRLNEHYEECLNIFREHYSKNMFNKTKPYDGIIDMLTSLKKNGYNLAVVSNKFDSAVKELCQKYFNYLINISIGQRENISCKPAPDSVLEVISELKVNKENCVYIGDSEVDIQTAQNAGIDCISVTWGYKDIDFLYKHGASVIAYLPEDILELL